MKKRKKAPATKASARKGKHGRKAKPAVARRRKPKGERDMSEESEMGRKHTTEGAESGEQPGDAAGQAQGICSPVPQEESGEANTAATSEPTEGQDEQTGSGGGQVTPPHGGSEASSR